MKICKNFSQILPHFLALWSELLIRVAILCNSSIIFAEAFSASYSLIFSIITARKRKFSIKDFFSKCGQISSFLRFHFLCSTACFRIYFGPTKLLGCCDHFPVFNYDNRGSQKEKTEEKPYIERALRSGIPEALTWESSGENCIHRWFECFIQKWILAEWN